MMDIILFGQAGCSPEDYHTLEMRGYRPCYASSCASRELVTWCLPVVLQPGTAEPQLSLAVAACRITGAPLLEWADLPAVAPESIAALIELDAMRKLDPSVPITIELGNGSTAMAYMTRAEMDAWQQVAHRQRGRATLTLRARCRSLWAACLRAEARINAFFGQGLKNPMSRQALEEAKAPPEPVEYRADQGPPATTA